MEDMRPLFHPGTTRSDERDAAENGWPPLARVRGAESVRRAKVQTRWSVGAVGESRMDWWIDGLMDCRWVRGPCSVIRAACLCASSRIGQEQCCRRSRSIIRLSQAVLPMSALPMEGTP